MKKTYNSKGIRQTTVVLNVSTESGSCRTVVLRDDKSDLKKLTSKWCGYMAKVVDCCSLILPDHSSIKKLGRVTLIQGKHNTHTSKIRVKVIYYSYQMQSQNGVARET